MATIDDNFANNMIMHHETTAAAAEQHLKDGSDPTLKDHAQDIADHSNGVVAKMHKFLGKSAGKSKTLADRNI